MHTNEFQILRGLSRSVPGDIEVALRRYDAQNPDLPPAPRRLLALAAIRSFFGTRRIELALGQSLPQVTRDPAWRWWNVLNYAGLEDYWNKFKLRCELDGVRRGNTYLLGRLGRREYLDFLRRAGVDPRNSHRSTSRHIWTKGGSWDLIHPMTTLLVRKKHLPLRPMFRRPHRSLGHKGVRLVEDELMRLIDPDSMLLLDARLRAIAYARSRINEICAYEAKRASAEVACWFFQCPIPSDRSNTVLEPLLEGRYIRERQSRTLRRPWGL